jgi:hypothetical protein
MNWLKKLPGSQRSPHGLEWALWKKLPKILLLGTLLPALGPLAARLWWTDDPLPAATLRLMTRIDFFAISLVVLHWTLVLTLAIGCAIIIVMKGPAYVADAYEVPYRDQPGGEPAGAASREGERGRAR